MQIHTLAFFENILGMDGIVLLVLGLLIFGRRLPEVGKNLGKTIVEFKKGLSGKDTEHPEPEPEHPQIQQEQRPARLVNGRISASTPSAQGTKSLPSTEEV